MQFMPSTWRLFSNIVYGEVREQTTTRERYVATMIIQSWLDEGLTAGDVALRWNQGHAGRCKAGTNSKGVAYDSCAYKEKILAYLSR